MAKKKNKSSRTVGEPGGHRAMTDEASLESPHHEPALDAAPVDELAADDHLDQISADAAVSTDAAPDEPADAPDASGSDDDEERSSEAGLEGEVAAREPADGVDDAEAEEPSDEAEEPSDEVDADDVDDEETADAADSEEPADQVDDEPAAEVDDQPADQVDDEPAAEDEQIIGEAEQTTDEAVAEPDEPAAEEDVAAADAVDEPDEPAAEEDVAAGNAVAEPDEEPSGLPETVAAGIPPAPPLPDELPTAALEAASPATVAYGATYAWAAPAHPDGKKRRKALWIGLAAGAAVVSLVASSLVLIAPGTAVAGVPVGGLTTGWAADVLSQRLETTTIVLTGPDGDVELTGADLGASVDAKGLAESAFADHPMWNPTKWFPEPVDAQVTIDPAAADAALQAVLPDLYRDPVDATLEYDAAKATYVTTPAEVGEGVDTDAVLAALRDAYDAGESRVAIEPTLAPLEPTTSTETANEAAATLNKILGTAGFYVGDERTVPIDRSVAASWLTVTRAADGTFAVSADEEAIQAVVDTLAKTVDRGRVNATVITDSGGDVLREVTAGVDGRTLGDTEHIAREFAAQLEAGDAVYKLPVAVDAFTTTALARRIEVDISAQRATLFENGKVVNSYAISSGLPGHDTDQGRFRIYAKVPLQNMGDRELKIVDYFTPNVPWISYFNGDEALHGTYWHNNFGHQMSHGCVNMPIDVAKYVYDWAPIGTEVWVHA